MPNSMKKANKKLHFVKFDVGSFAHVVLSNDRFPGEENNKLAARNIGLVEIIEKINPNAYHLKLPSHIRTSDVINVKHLIPLWVISDDDSNSRMKSF